MTTLSLMARLGQVNGSPSEFLTTLLEVQCDLAPAQGAAVIVVEGAHARVLVMHPPLRNGNPTPVWLAQSAELAARVEDGTQVSPLVRPGARSGPTSEHLVLIPMQGARGSRAVAAYLVATSEKGALDRARERLELTVSLLSLYEMRLSLNARRGDLDRLRHAMQVLDAINVQPRMKAAAIAFCNEVATQWNAERVAIGFLSGRYVKSAALSHTDKYDRKMKLVQDLESAMEECLDQDVEILHPPAHDATYVSKAAAGLSARHGPSAVLSLPLRHDGEPVAVVTIERGADQPLTVDEIESLRLTCDLSTARLHDLHQHDRWIGAKLASGVRHGAAWLVGARHTWAKLTGLAVLGFLLFAFLVEGPDRVDAGFEIQANARRQVPAPFPGRIESINVKPGDPAEAGVTVLGTLETAELQLRLSAVQAERAGYLKEADLALRDDEQVEVQIAEANLQRTDAEIRLLEHQLAHATLVAPITGTVISEDLNDRIGAPVELGELMFEVAPLDSLRADLAVPEDRITDLVSDDPDAEQFRGTLASVAHPGDYVPFVVEHVNPVAEVKEQENVFIVRVRLLETRPWFKPGLTGVAKIDVGERPYAILWTRKAVNWLRMKLWI